jgi:ABC-2 type transport system permease protein
MIRTILAFVKKDFLITVSYRFDFVLKTAFILAGVAILFFVGRLVDSASFPFLKSYGGSYFGFLLIGVIFVDYLGISLNSFANNIRDGQLTGTLEIILTSPTRLSTFLIASSTWGYLFTSFRIGLYLITSIFVFGLDIGKADIWAAFVIFLISIVCYVAIGIIFASLILLVKKGDSALNAIGGLSLVLSGVFFPPQLLPPWMTHLSEFIPFTYSLHGLRLSVLEGYSVIALKGDVLALSIFSAVFLLISCWSFPYAVNRSKKNGTLTQY